MSPARGLSSDERRLAAATERAIKAVGGLKVAHEETGLSTSQLSRCESIDHRDSLTIRDALAIDCLSAREDGAPHITRTLARLLGFVLVPLPSGPEDPDGLMQSVAALTIELGDVAASIRDGLRDGDFSPREREAALEQLDELDQASAALRLKLKPPASAGEG